MGGTEIVEKCLSWAIDKGWFFAALFLFSSVAIIKMDDFFGYPLNWPTKCILISLLVFGCVYTHYLVKAIRLKF